MKKTAFIAAAVAAMVLGIFAYAGAATPATGTVTVKANVNPKLELTLSSNTIDFGPVDPGTTGSSAETLTVKSNKSFTVSRGAETGFSTDDASAVKATSLSEALGLTLTGAPFDGSVTQPKGGNTTLTDTYSYNIPWTTNPANYSANYTYTVTQ